MNDQRLMTLIEVADRCRVSVHTVRKWVRIDRLQPTRLCRRLLFDPAAVEALIARSSGKQP